MEILPMLARLEHALGCSDLARQMVLKSNLLTASRASQQKTNLVVGYNDSPQSHTALDLTLWIAYQTRLATRKTVTVQVVYVVDAEQSRARQPRPMDSTPFGEGDRKVPLYCNGNTLEPIPWITRGIPAAELTAQAMAMETVERPIDQGVNWQIHQFEQADRILWQARSLANEWRGSLETHLRFGPVATELRDVACKKAATVLVVGCESAEHPLVEALGDDLPYPVLGIPPRICRV